MVYALSRERMFWFIPVYLSGDYKSTPSQSSHLEHSPDLRAQLGASLSRQAGLAFKAHSTELDHVFHGEIFNQS